MDRVEHLNLVILVILTGTVIVLLTKLSLIISTKLHLPDKLLI